MISQEGHKFLTMLEPILHYSWGLDIFVIPVCGMLFGSEYGMIRFSLDDLPYEISVTP
jgi:hypothetical protein